MQLEGKNVIYIGGFGGIGQKCVEAFLKKSVKSLLIFDLNPNDEYLTHLRNTYKNAYVDYVPLDLSKSENVAKAYRVAKDKIGTFDIVVNGSGSVDEQKVDLLVQINLTGLIHSSLIAMDYMSKAKGGQGGCIVNISSTTGLNPTELLCIYGATKSAVLHFTRSLSKPLYFDKTGVRFLTICPGATATPILHVAGQKCFSGQYFAGLSDVMANLETQSTTVFAENLMHVVKTAPNGTTWVLDDGDIHEVHFPEVWGPAIKEQISN